MIKGIYLGNMNVSSGVSKKINQQINIFQKNYIDIEAPVLNSTLLLSMVFGRIPFAPSTLAIAAEKHLTTENINLYDFIYIRRPLIDAGFLRMLKKIKTKKPNIKILMEIPTYPYDKEQFVGLFDLPYLLKEKLNRNKLKKYIDRIITYSNDNEIFEVPTIKLSNGTDIANISKRKIKNKNTIDVIAVSTMSFWHGYDRFIEGMGEYYKENRDRKIIFHLVGTGRELDKYKNLISKYNLENYVILHGKKTGIDLDKIYDHSDIALDSMGRHRAGINFNSTIKGKEYGAKGLPIISGVETELDSCQDYKYYMRVEASDNPIDMFSVINFYDYIYNNGETSKQIIDYIHNYTKMHFDISVTFKPVIDYLKSTIMYIHD